MKRYNRFKYYKISARLWKPLVLISSCVVLVIELTNWRPFGYSSIADNVNRFLATLSYSIIGANLFYCFNEYIPSLSKKYVSKEHVSHQLWKIKEQIRLLIEMDLHPFCLERKRITEEGYIADFESTDLNEISPFGNNNSKADVINKRTDTIVRICNELLSSYLNVLTENQLGFISVLFASPIVRVGLKPTIWDENNEPVIGYDDNQREIGKCIYFLYKQSSILLK